MDNKLGDIIEIEAMQVFIDNPKGNRFPIGQLKKRLMEKTKEYLKKELLTKIANNSHFENSQGIKRRVVEIEMVSNIIHELE